MDIRIEPIREEHIEGFHAALDSVARERLYLTMHEAPPLEETRKFHLGNIEKGVPAFVALDGDKVVGWCDATSSPRTALAHHATVGMGIIDGYRQQGIGTRLLSAVIESARAKGLHHLYLGVYRQNVLAQTLYKKLGFVETGVEPKFYQMPDGSYEDDIIMWLPLAVPDPSN